MSANYQLLHSKWYKISIIYLKIPFIQKPAMILKCSSLNSLPRVDCLTKFHKIDNRKIKYKLLMCIFVKNKQQNILKRNFPIPIWMQSKQISATLVHWSDLFFVAFWTMQNCLVFLLNCCQKWSVQALQNTWLRASLHSNVRISRFQTAQRYPGLRGPRAP